jgi:hypothetical protein
VAEEQVVQEKRMRREPAETQSTQILKSFPILQGNILENLVIVCVLFRDTGLFCIVYELKISSRCN